MPVLSKAQLLAIRAVARHYHASWQIGECPPDAYATVNGRKIALDVAVIRQSRPSKRLLAKARLREDVVARRVLHAIKSALGAHVPQRKTIILTLGAPIKVPKQLIVALSKLLLNYIQGGIVERDERKTILGNRVRFRVLSDDPSLKAKVIGFVFSGDPAPGSIANSMRWLHDEIGARAKRRMPKGFAGDRWLLLGGDGWIADSKTYRLIYSQLSLDRGFKRIFMVLDGGRVEPLAELRARPSAAMGAAGTL